MKKIILVTTNKCPHCPAAKQLWKELKKEYKFEYEEVDGLSAKGQELVHKFSIMSVPTTIIEEDGKGRVAFVGVPQKEKAIEAIKG